MVVDSSPHGGAGATRGAVRAIHVLAGSPEAMLEQQVVKWSVDGGDWVNECTGGGLVIQIAAWVGRGKNELSHEGVESELLLVWA